MFIFFSFDSLTDITCLFTDILVSVLCGISLHILERVHILDLCIVFSAASEA
jgi:hypothetical protein